MKMYPIFGVKTWMNDSIHVEVEIIEFEAVRVWFTGVHRNRDAVDHDGLFFDDIDHHQRILLRQPPIESRNSHCRIAPSSKGSRISARKRGKGRENRSPNTQSWNSLGGRRRRLSNERICQDIKPRARDSVFRKSGICLFDDKLGHEIYQWTVLPLPNWEKRAERLMFFMRKLGVVLSSYKG